MGVWSTGPFGNDEALDFAAEIRTIDDLSDAVRLHDEGVYLEVDRSSRIIVVAECVAAMRGHPHEDLPDDLAQRLDTFDQPSDELYDNARDSVSLVITNSELSELWAESNDRAGFNRAMTDLIDRLNRPIIGMAQKARKARKDAPTNSSPCWICGEPMGAEFTSISVTLDPQSGMSQGGSVHLACLNAALHPKYLVQDWQFDDAMIERLTGDIFGKDDKS